MATRKVKILKDTMAGGEFVKAGKEVEVTQRDAHLLTNIGRATYTDRMVEPAGADPRATDTTELIEGQDSGKGKKAK